MSLLRLIERLIGKSYTPPYSGPDPGVDTSLTYSKAVEDWTDEDRKNAEKMIVKEKIVGLERRVGSTVMPEKPADLTEVFKNASEEVTKAKFN